MKNIEDVKRVLDFGKVTIRSEAAKDNAAPFEDFQNVFFQIFGSTPSTCNDCPGGFESSFEQLENYYNRYLINPEIINMENKIKIKGGGTLVSTRGIFSQAELDDSLALKLIKEFPNMAKTSFEADTLPKDLDKVLESVTTIDEDAIIAAGKKLPKSEKEVKEPEVKEKPKSGKEK